MLRLGFLFVLFGSFAYSQTSSATLTGAVLDSSGAVISGAQVRIMGTETGDTVRTLTTDELRHFTAPLLPPRP